MMNQISKTEQVVKEIRQYLIDILVLSEIRWTGNGLEKFSDPYAMAFSGHPSVHRAEAKLQLQLLLDAVDEKAEKIGFAANFIKTKIKATSDSPLILKCKDKTIEQVKELKYLGSWIEYDGEIANEIKREIGQASSAFSKMKPFWRSS
ncbi:hypothetical protein QYM36_011699 [Artemia franciscana]|uniref:Uncharacterized protein n=1 Tax=Artemia franciscana TaxID=6661 RepID=A0AA88HP68_ARTSF|nr:hypothetical protein QYM36_011699 [Artemia franciscana]